MPAPPPASPPHSAHGQCYGGCLPPWTEPRRSDVPLPAAQLAHVAPPTPPAPPYSRVSLSAVLPPCQGFEPRLAESAHPSPLAPPVPAATPALCGGPPTPPSCRRSCTSARPA